MIYLTLLLLTIYLPDFDSGQSEETDLIFELQATGGTESNRDHSQPLKEKEKCQYKAITMQSSNWLLPCRFWDQTIGTVWGLRIWQPWPVYACWTFRKWGGRQSWSWCGGWVRRWWQQEEINKGKVQERQLKTWTQTDHSNSKYTSDSGNTLHYSHNYQVRCPWEWRQHY